MISLENKEDQSKTVDNIFIRDIELKFDINDLQYKIKHNETIEFK